MTNLESLSYMSLRNPMYLHDIVRNSHIRRNLYLSVEHLQHFLKGWVLSDLEGPMAFSDPVSDKKTKCAGAVGGALCEFCDRLVIGCLLSTTSVGVVDKICGSTVSSCTGA